MADSNQIPDYSLGVPAHTLENINSLSCWLGGDGLSAHNPLTDNTGLIFPRGTAGVVFQDGIVWGGYVNDGAQPALRVGGQTSRIGTMMGAIISAGIAEDPSAANVRIWRIRSDYATANLYLEALDMGHTEEQIRYQYASDWASWPWQKGAPFYDTGYLAANGTSLVGVHNGVLDRGEDLNSNGILDSGEDANGNGVLDGEFPGIAHADQVIWTVANDLNASQTDSLYGSPPIGLEMQITLWGYGESPRFNLGLSTTIFKRIRLIYKGTSTTSPTATIDSMFIAQWSDVAIGDAENDLVGCDSINKVGYAYNGYYQDSEFILFGLAPPAIGYTLLQGPVRVGQAGQDLNRNGIDDSQDYALYNFKWFGPGYINLPMTSFSYTAPNQSLNEPQIGQYNGTLQWYNMLRGYQPTTNLQNPTPYICGSGRNAGQPTLFPLAGNPWRGYGDLDGTGNNLPAGNRKMTMASGPFTMAFGDTQEIILAVTGGSTTDRLSAVEMLKLDGVFAQIMSDSLFIIPKPPPAPLVNATGLDEMVALTWDTASESHENLGFEFEGYNVYISSSPYGPWNKIKTFDRRNNITIIRTPQFDPVYGDVIIVPIQTGTDNGLQHYLEISKDSNGNSLVNGITYYFTVTAYNYNPDFPQSSYENYPNPVSAVPIGAVGGINYSTAGVDSSVNHLTGKSTGRVLVDVVDPSKVTGHTYQVNFEENTDTDLVWNLLDLTESRTVLYQQSDLGGSPSTPIVDGLLVSVIDPDPGVKQDDRFTTDDTSLWGWNIPSGELRFSWKGGANSFNFEGFQGAIGWNQPATLLGSGYNYPEGNLRNVLLVLAETDTAGIFNPADPYVSYAYRYGRNFDSPPARPEFTPFIINSAAGYSYQDFTPNVPLSAFDVDDPENPRRLVVGFLENNASGGLVNGRWWPPDYHSANNCASNGPREWLWIFDADYGSTPDPSLQVELINNELPIMYWLTVARDGSVSFSPGQSGEDQFNIYPNHLLTVNDTFQFKINLPIRYTNTKGDVNADSTINISDVVTLINFILQQDTLSSEQQYAADFNSDLHINVADVVGIINSILGIQQVLAKIPTNETVQIGLEAQSSVNNGILEIPLLLTSKQRVSGIQIMLSYNEKILKPLAAFFQSEQWNKSTTTFHSSQDGKVTFLFYNLSGQSLPVAEPPVLRFEILENDNNPNCTVNLNEAVVAGIYGKSMEVTYSNTSVSPSAVPKSYALFQNFPNPFNASTTIRYDLPRRSKVTIEIYNVLGQKVRTLLNKSLISGGKQRIFWNGLDDHNLPISSGIYFIRFRANDFMRHSKMILLK